MSSDLLERANPAASTLLPVVKAHFVGERSGVQSTVITETERASTVFGGAGALEPTYDPNVLALIYENSSALRPNVDAYIANIDSFGHCYVPVLETDAVDADEKIRDALRLERFLKKRDGRYAADSDVLLSSDEPTDAEVKKRREQLKIEIRTERAVLGAFFENCTYDLPFSGPEGLRGLTRQDIEVIGSGYWEVLRNGLGAVCQFNHIPAVTVRMMPMDDRPTEVVVERKISMLSAEKVAVRKRFRRYIQTRNGLTLGGDVVFFKEFGDPRIVSAKTGKSYETVEAMREVDEEKDAAIATEILAFKISSTRSAYGVPRWIGALLSVLGTRQAEEVNFLYFENRSVPPLAILVSGGRLNENSIERIETYVENEIKGKRNFHKIMILEAEPSDATPGQQALSSHMKIELRPLTDAQQKDALFAGYDERNEAKVGQSFRLPPILRGSIKDFNRSTAGAAIDFAEIQVFGPLRQQFDWVMNQCLFPALGIRYHTFKSNAPTVRDPEQLAKMIALITGSSILTPAEARDLAQDVFNRSFDNLDDEWTKQPLAVTLAKLNAEGNSLDDFEDAGGMSAPNAGQAQRQAGVRQAPAKTSPDDRSKPKPKSTDAVRATGKAAALQRGITKMKLALLNAEMGEMEEQGELETEVVRVPAEEFKSWFRPNT